MAEYKAPVWLSLLVGSAVLYALWTLRDRPAAPPPPPPALPPPAPRPVVIETPPPQPAGDPNMPVSELKGWTLGFGISLLATSNGLPRSVVIAPLSVKSGSAVSLNRTDTGEPFAKVTLGSPSEQRRELNAIPKSFLAGAPEAESAKLFQDVLVGVAVSRFFDDERVSAAIDLGSRIEWRADGEELNFHLYPSPKRHPNTGIGMRFFVNRNESVVVGQWMTQTRKGWVRLGKDRLYCNGAQSWIIEQNTPEVVGPMSYGR